MFLVIKRNAGLVSCGLVTLLATTPVWFIRFAPLHDLPFHAARMAILHDVIYGGSLDRFYALNSLFIPNSAIDCAVLILSIIFTIETSCRILIITICFLIIYGIHFVNSNLFRYSPVIILLAALFTYNSVFTIGFLNYLFGLGLLLFAVGLHIRIRNRNATVRLVIGSLAALVLFLAHIVAFVLYAIVIAGLELQAGWSAIKTAPTAAVERLLISGSPFLLILTLFYGLSPTSDAMGDAIRFGGSSLAEFAKLKQTVVRTMLAGRQNDILDLAQTLFAGSLVIAFLILGSVRIAKGAYLALLLLCLSFVLAPDALLGGSYLSFRLPIAIAFVFLAFTEFVVDDVRIHRAFVAVLITGLFLRTAVVVHDWRLFDQVQQQFMAAFKCLPTDSILFVVRGNDGTLDVTDPDWRPPIKHYASLATVAQGVFVPSTVADPGQWTIRVRPEFNDIYAFQGSVPTKLRDTTSLEKFVQEVRRLGGTDRSGGVTNIRLRPYLLLLNPDALGDPRPINTRLIAATQLFSLHEIGTADAQRGDYQVGPAASKGCDNRDTVAAIGKKL